MTDRTTLLIPRSPYAGLQVPPSGHGGVAITEPGLGIAIMLARRHQAATLAQCMCERLRIALPDGPYRTSVQGLALAGIGPDAWLAILEHGGNAFAASLQKVVGNLASIADQTDGYTVLRLQGPRVRDALCKLVPVDVHPRAFRVGDVAVTKAAHMPVTLWWLEDLADGSPVFETAAPRSLARCFWQALSQSAAEFGG